MRRVLLAFLAVLAMGMVAVPSASALVRHYEGKVITDPERPTIEFDVVGVRKNHKFVPRRIKNMQVQPDLEYEYCPACPGGSTRLPYFGPAMTATPTVVKRKGTRAKPRFTFFDLYEVPCGIYTCSRTTWAGRFKPTRRVVTGRLFQEQQAGGLEFGTASRADERFRAEF
jgi:hypothetical protein